jgi:hypothetical protein
MKDGGYLPACFYITPYRSSVSTAYFTTILDGFHFAELTVVARVRRFKVNALGLLGI